MWQLAKRVLPNTALERILFPSKDELLEFFEEDCLLKGESTFISPLSDLSSSQRAEPAPNLPPSPPPAQSTAAPFPTLTLPPTQS